MVFQLGEVERLIALASSAARGRTLAERLEESFARLGELVPNTGNNVLFLDAVRGEGQALHVKGFPRRDLEEYVSHYRFVDPMAYFMVDAPNELKTLSDAATPREVERTEFHDLISRTDVRSIAGWAQPIGGGRLVAIGVHRASGQADFKARERALLALVMPLIVASVEDHLRDPAPLERLTPAERAVVGLLVRGLRDRAIAARLGVGFATVRTHIQKAFTRLAVSNRAELLDVVVRSRRPLDARIGRGARP